MRKLVHMMKRAIGKKAPSVKRVRVLVDAPSDKVFRVAGGPACKNVAELRAAIVSMSDGQYAFHTVPRGNDFARWVRDVLDQKQLAGKLEKAANRAETIALLG